jgi:hypothetical protein
MLVFPVTSYPWRAFAALIALTVILPLVVVAIALALAQTMPGWLFVFLVAVALGFMLSVSVGLSALLIYVATRNEITLRDGTIHLKGGSYHERVPLAAITGARIVNLARDRAVAPATRENGMRLPGYQVGWYTLRDGTWAFVLRSARTRAVYIETNREFAALLGVRQPERLLAQIESSG